MYFYAFWKNTVIPLSSCGTFGDVKSCLSRGGTETWELSVTVSCPSCREGYMWCMWRTVWCGQVVIWVFLHGGVYHRNTPNKSLVCLWLTHLLSDTLLVIQPRFSSIPHYTSPLNSCTSVYPHTSGRIQLLHLYVFFFHAPSLPLTV